MKQTAKQIQAQALFTSGKYLQKEIGVIVGVNEKTIGAWVEKFKWKDLRSSLTVTKEAQIKMILNHIDEINTGISQREVGQRTPTTKETDSLIKLSTTLKNLEADLGISEMVTFGIKFIEHIKRINFDKGKDVGLLFDGFISSYLK